MPQKKIGFNDSQLKADKLIIHNGLTASATLEFVGATAIAFRLPQAAGSAGQAVITDGVGNLSFTTITGAQGPTGPAGAQNLNQTLLLGNTASVPILASDGSAALPSVSFINSTGTGLHTVSNELRLSANGVLAQQVTSVSTRFLSGSTASPGIGFINDADTGFRVRGGNNFAAVAGALDMVVFANIAGAPLMAMANQTTGKFYSGDGTALSPGISYESDTNTGIFRPGADQLSISAGGVEVVRFTTQFLAPNGTTGAPPISFINDPDTGLNRSASNELAIVAGGVNSTVFDGSTASGNTRFLVFDVSAAAFKRVSVGATDSGGVGFKVLRIPN